MQNFLKNIKNMLSQGKSTRKLFELILPVLMNLLKFGVIMLSLSFYIGDLFYFSFLPKTCRDYSAAVSILKRATAVPARRGDYFDEASNIQVRVSRSLKLWSLYADIEESIGTIQSCSEIYDKMMELRIGLFPQIYRIITP